MRKLFTVILTVWAVSALLIPGGVPFLPAQAAPDGHTIFIPLLSSPPDPNTFSARVNLPYFSDGSAQHFSEAAVSWFGAVTPSQNYADIRLSYDSTRLWVYFSASDHYLWYNPTPASSPLTDWDSISLRLDLTGTAGTALGAQSYRFDAAMSWYEARSAYQAAYRWQNGQWSAQPLAFQSTAGYDGYFNDNQRASRGWAITLEIPFASLGLAGRPSEGTLWGASLSMHDRDSLAGPPQADQAWPAGAQLVSPSTWAQLRFGLPDYGAHPGAVSGSDIIRRDPSRGLQVKDAGVGGTTPNLCPGDETYIWNQWGAGNFGSQGEFSIQNQSNIVDWPCFSKVYISFPLASLPANKQILSARLVLHHQGSAGNPGAAQPSLIQVLTVGQDWDEAGITWNNAPPPLENVARTWVSAPLDYGAWPKIRVEWDVTGAAARAYAAGQPLRLVLYEADAALHSGKYFTSSDTGDWNLAGRPALEIAWGER